MTRLETMTLSSGARIVRPHDCVGTCGWYPKAWTIAVIKRRETPKSAFLKANPNWSEGDLV